MKCFARSRIDDGKARCLWDFSVNLVVVIDGGTPPGPAITTAPISAGSCTAAHPCVVSGPRVPPGQYEVSIVTSDQNDGTGNLLDSFDQNVTIVGGQDNQFNATLLGIPKTVTLTNVPVGSAGALLSQALTVTVNDAANQERFPTLSRAIRNRHTIGPWTF